MRRKDGSALSENRAEIRVFLGSSEELREERAGFVEGLKKVGERADLRRNFVLSPVRWETDGFGFSDDINATIQSSVEFERLHVVIILVRNRIGKGTLDEYEKALRLDRTRKRPRLMVFVREPSPDADEQDMNAVRAFKERVIADGGVPNTYSTVAEFWQRLAEQLPTVLPRPVDDEPTTPNRLRRLFLISSFATFGLSAVVLFIASLMSFPGNNTTYLNVLMVLNAPPVIFFGSTLSLWAFHRLLNSLKVLWWSPRFDDPELYETFRGAIPRFSIPKRLKAQFPNMPGSQLLQVVILAIAFVAPGVAQFQMLYQEILLWQYVVGWETIDEDNAAEYPGGRCVPTAQQNFVRSRYVDCAPRERLTFALRDETVLRIAKDRDWPVIYVHAHGKFARGRDLPPNERFRHNLGPEIFLPWQPRIYFALLILTLFGVLFTAWRLLRFRYELAPRK